MLRHSGVFWRRDGWGSSRNEYITVIKRGSEWGYRYQKWKWASAVKRCFDWHQLLRIHSSVVEGVGHEKVQICGCDRGCGGLSGPSASAERAAGQTAGAPAGGGAAAGGDEHRCCITATSGAHFNRSIYLSVSHTLWVMYVCIIIIFVRIVELRRGIRRRWDSMRPVWRAVIRSSVLWPLRTRRPCWGESWMRRRTVRECLGKS